MPSILQNITAMAASRQIGITQHGLKQAIERLTTGKRVNRASDDAAAMSAGNAAEAAGRSTGMAVKLNQAQYYVAQSADAFLGEATNLSYRLSELEGSGNTTATEYTATQALVSAAWAAALNQLAAKVGASSVGALTAATIATQFTNATTALTTIQTARDMIAGIMATANSNANLNGISSENNLSISDTWLGADVGAETVNLTKYQIMMQAGTNALTQANQASQTVLALFR